MQRSAEQLAHAITTLEARRALLGDDVVDMALAPLRAELAALHCAQPTQPVPPGQQLRQVSVLFLDIVGSTAMGSVMDPEDIAVVIDGALAAFTRIIDQQGGKVLQYAGDSVLAAFGADEAQEDDAERAVLAGLALLRQARVESDRVLASHGHAGFGVRVGIGSGAVLMGGGVDGAHSIRGSTVNIAARMEQTAPPGSLRICQDTWRLVRGLFRVEEQPPLLVKGRVEAMQTYLVQGTIESPLSAQRRGVDGVRVPLLGRQAELAALQAAYRRVCSEPAAQCVITVVAEAGLGKTRLLEEFGLWLTQQGAGVAPLQARGVQRRQGRPYGLMAEIFMAWLGAGAAPGTHPAPLRQAWLDAAGAVLGHAGSAALLGHLIGLDFSEQAEVQALRADARALRDRAFFHAVQLLGHASLSATPLILVLDDLHWADEGSLEFLDHLVHMRSSCPLLLIALARPLLFERWPQWHSDQRLDLAALSGDASQTLTRALLQRLPEVPPALTQLVVDGAQGNPFFMEELVNMLIDQGAITVKGDVWSLQAERLQALQMPATLSGVMQARLDALPQDRRRALQFAAVAGPVFWDQALQQLDLMAVSALGELAQRALINEQALSRLHGAHEYAFRHHAMQRVAYASVLKRVKRAAHATLARWLASLSDADAWQDQIAEHYERGGDTALAREAWQRAAESARSRFANAEALAHAERAWALTGADDLPRLLALMQLRVRVHEGLAQRAVLAQLLQEMQLLAQRLGDAGWLCEVAARWANHHFHGGDAQQGLDCAQRAVALAPPGEPERAAIAHGQVCSALLRLGHPEQAQAAAEQALRFARQAQHPGYEARTLNEMGSMAFGRGDVDGAALHWNAALALHLHEGHLANQGGTLCNLAFVAMAVGDFDTAAQQFEQARALSERVGQRQNDGVITINLGIVAMNQGHSAAAHAHATRALELLRATGDRWAEAAALRVLGQAEQGLGQPERARELMGASRDLFDELKMPHLALEAMAALVQEALARGDTAAALRHSEDILARRSQGVAIAGTDEPMRILLALWRGLQAANDPRAATALAQARAELAQRAGRLLDPAQRQRFLHAVACHREILEGEGSVA